MLERVVLLLIFSLFLNHLELVSRKWFVLETAIFTHGILRVLTIGAEAFDVFNYFGLVEELLGVWYTYTLTRFRMNIAIMLFILYRVFSGRACEAANNQFLRIMNLILFLDLLNIWSTIYSNHIELLIRHGLVLVLASLS